ncbi:MAG: CDC48 family AAA ATPase [Nanoarchaeota archaeon]|nr:CDC48 family AAA ATPase [Nanoarchaeota archaeon]
MNKTKKPNEEKYLLKIAESLQEDINKGIARISSKDMKKMNLIPGDIIQLKNKTILVVKVLRALGRENSLGKIRLDGTMRSNLGSSIGEDIEIKKVEVKPATQITLSPLQEIRLSKESSNYLHSKFLDFPLSPKQKLTILASGNKLKYIVSKVTPKGNVIITPSTEFILSEEIYSGQTATSSIYYEDIGGLKEEIELVREMVELPMKQPEVFEKLGISAPKGVLLTGPPGTGKTLLAKAVATETDANFYSIAGPEIMSKFYGESEKHVREIFEKAQKNAPSIVFIDEIDSIAPKRGEGIDQTEKRIVAQLLTLMDGLKSREQVVVMAATNRPDDIDMALRRPGRFDRELKINPPMEEGRKEILQIHTRGMPLGNDVNFNELAKRTIGYVGADLEVLCKEAGLKALKPHLADFKNLNEKLPAEELDKIKILRKDFIEALKQVEPSAMREVLIKKPNIKWTDIGGLKKAKEKLRELVELPLLRPELYLAAGIKPSKGVLLHGPPGTGKTLLAKAVATEANANFISIKGPELISKWVGESEKHIREIFKKAKQVSPSIIFFDEFDSISKLRGSGMGNDSSEKVVNQLLTELDGVEELENVMIIAATNRKDLIDSSLLRPGRIDAHVELSAPDLETRKEIFKVHTKNMPLEKEINLEEISQNSEGWTGADIEAICRNAGINAIKRNYLLKDMKKLKITKKDFDNSFEELIKQIGKGKSLIKKSKDKISKTVEKNISEKKILDKENIKK